MVEFFFFSIQISNLKISVPFSEFDVSFKKLAVDTCETCDRLQMIIRDSDQTDATIKKAEDKLYQHLVVTVCVCVCA